MSQEHLKPVRSKEEARELGRKGGLASVKARRKKRSMQEAAKIFLEMAADGSLKSNLEALGVAKQDQTYMMAMIARAFTLAMAGDLKAMEFLRDTAGYGPKVVQKIEHSGKVEKVEKDETTNGLAETEEGRELLRKLFELKSKKGMD